MNYNNQQPQSSYPQFTQPNYQPQPGQYYVQDPNTGAQQVYYTQAPIQVQPQVQYMPAPQIQTRNVSVFIENSNFISSIIRQSKLL